MLEFTGGSISGSNTLTFVNTGITGTPKILCAIAGMLEKADIAWFGAVSGDSTDDIGVIINKLNGHTSVLIIPAGSFYIKTACNISAQKTEWLGVVTYNGSSREIDVVTISGQFKTLKMAGSLDCQGSAIDYTTATQSNIRGIVFKNCYFGNFEVGCITRFNVQMMLIGEGSGCSYNKFFLTLLRHGNIGILITQKDNNGSSGWANENMFIGGEINNYEPYSFESHAVVAKRIYNDDTSADVNSLYFLKQSCEGYYSNAVFVLEDADGVVVEQVRMEASSLAYKLIGNTYNFKITSSFGGINGDISELSDGVNPPIDIDLGSYKNTIIDLSDGNEIYMVESGANKLIRGKRYVFGLDTDLKAKRDDICAINNTTWFGNYWGVEIELPNSYCDIVVNGINYTSGNYIGVVAKEFYDGSDVDNAHALLRRASLSFVWGTTWSGSNLEGYHITFRKGVKRVYLGFNAISKVNILLPPGARIIPLNNPEVQA